MRYEVQPVGDDELPEGIHVVIVEREREPHLMLLNGLPARVWRLMREWENDLGSASEPSLLYAV